MECCVWREARGVRDGLCVVGGGRLRLKSAV